MNTMCPKIKEFQAFSQFLLVFLYIFVHIILYITGSNCFRKKLLQFYNLNKKMKTLF